MITPPKNGPFGGVAKPFTGPSNRTLWDKQSVSDPPAAVAKAVKKTKMPSPTKDQDSKDLHVVTWPLFKSAKGGPAFSEVKQAPGIANCPVASVLAALASTAAGQALIQRMVSEKAGDVLTDLTGLPSGTLSNPPPGNTISSARYFTVNLSGGPIEVSDVLYTDDHDRGWSPLYLRDPNEQAIWGSVIEKALAVKLGSYENFDAVDRSANGFWELITGVKPGGIEIKADTPLATITDAVKASTRVPTIGASKPEASDVKFVSEFHGHAILGFQGPNIRLYDPAKAKIILISPANFRHDFQAILFQK